MRAPLPDFKTDRLVPADVDQGGIFDGVQPIARCTAAAWRSTRYGRRLLLEVELYYPTLAGVTGYRSYWTSRGSSSILSRRFGSQDPADWPDSFVLPLMIAHNVKNPRTGERKDRVWVLPADLWPDAMGGGATAGGGT